MSGLVSASLSFSDEQKKEVSSTPAFGSSGSFQTTNSAPAFGSSGSFPSISKTSGFGSSTSSTQSPFGGTANSFQASGSLEFGAGGSFSMGSSGVGGDKSGRRNFKAKRMVKKMGSTAPSFTSSVVNNDQMQVFSQQLASLTMAEDNVNSSMPVAPMFSQQPMPSPPGGYAQSTNPFQFAGQQNQAAPQMPFVFSGQQNQAAQQNAKSFQASGSLEFKAKRMGSSGVGGDKSGRRNFKAKRMVKKMGSSKNTNMNNNRINSSRLEQTLQDGLLYRQVNSLIVAHLRDNNLNQIEKEMEGGTYEICLDAVLASLKDLKGFECFVKLGSQTETMKLEISLLKMFFWGLTYLEELEYDWSLHFAMKSMMPKLRRIAGEFVAECCIDKEEYCETNLDVVMYDFVETIDEQLRPQAKDVCILLLSGSNYMCTPCPPSQKKFVQYGKDTAAFNDLILQNIKALLNSDMISSVIKQQIALIQGELEKYGTTVNPSEKKLYEVVSRARSWLIRISCLTYIYWSGGIDESMESGMGSMLSRLLHESTSFSTTGVISSHFQPTLIPQLLASHFDFLLESLVIPMKDDIEILYQGLTILLSFILDPPEDRGRISEKIFATLNNFPSLNFSNFMLEIDILKAEVRKVHVMTPYSSQTISLKTNVLGFFNSMMENLENILEGRVTLISSIKNACELLWTDFVFLRPLLKNLAEMLQGDDNNKIRDLWREIIEVVYNADYFIKLSHVRFFYAWYVILGLDYVIEHVRSIKVEINKLVEVDKTHFKKNLNRHGQAETDTLRPRGTTSEVERVCIGFVEDQKVIVDELTSRGKTSLTVISISGLGGQGKTTFAKRIYNHPNLQCYFQKFVWCYVSEKCPVKEVLVQALCVDTKSVDDLREQLWRSLRKKRYLVVLDDIWDEDAWRKLEWLFPNDKNGSRILLTTRNHDLASKFIPNSISHRLPLFSDEESWKLIKNENFGPGNCNEALTGVGMKIASYCKGLPLAVVLIAALLGRTEQNLVLWNKVADNLKTHLADEGCGKVIELSYNYLPDHLKTCFQYFATFKRGTNVRAKELMLLWIGEGFVTEDENLKFSEEDMANQYLNTLVSQGLVVVTERSSTGGIKTCNVHDLLYDMCLEKCQDDNSLNWLEESVFVGDVNKLHEFNHHRLWIGEKDPFLKPSPIVTKRELPTSSLHSFLWWDGNYYVDRDYLRFLVSFKILTVLNLSLDLDDGEFPEVILSCIFLRYLRIHILNGIIRAIPPTIANLWKLGILIISKSKVNFWVVTKLPRSLWSMKRLRHVDVRYASLDLKDSDGKNCSNLFGGECSNIVTLRSILFDKIDGTIAAFLRNFPRLRKFSCEIKERNDHILKLLSMVGSQSPQLESLQVIDYGNNNQVYESVTNPIAFSVLSKMENLNRLGLGGTELPWSLMSEIGKQLPNLRVGDSWKLGDGGFSKLVYLKLRDLDFEEINDSSCEENPFPCLQHLVLEGCINLREIPPVFEEITTLETIKVTNCSENVEASAMKVLEVQRDYGNDILRVIIEKEEED